MKKVLIGVLLIVMCVAFTACGGSNKVDLALDNLAEVRYNIFAGENEKYTATFMSGKRETPYVVDGVCNKRVEFGMLTIKYKSSDSPIVAKYKIVINEKEYVGNLEYNNYDNTLMVDINQVVDDDADIIVSVITNQDEVECKLTPKTTDIEITWRTALDIAIETLGDEYKEYISKGKLNGEIYIKIITDLNSNFDSYYWYVSFVGKNGNSNGVIIDPNDGQVIART